MSVNQHSLGQKLSVGGVSANDLTLALLGTDGALLTRGTTAQRPSGASLLAGVLRYNTTIQNIEWYNGSEWLTVVPYTDQQAQDAVGNILVNSSSVNFSYDPFNHEIGATVNNLYVRQLFSGINGITYINTTGVIEWGGK
jgi:hypothetical protein